ncbi:hypothetical protein HanRHA438_Chr09g0382721 [Helianthus annuus]|nr:hypothetical protein HanRHA438_Chr09g0382721 [Helianthus annuus]
MWWWVAGGGALGGDVVSAGGEEEHKDKGLCMLNDRNTLMCLAHDQT